MRSNFFPLLARLVPSLAALGAVAAWTGGCASTSTGTTAYAYKYAYKPVQSATASVAGHLAAEYPVPPALPHGDVKVATMGVTALEARPGEPRTEAMHIRMVLHNQDDPVAWQLDTRQQLGRIGAYGQSRPILASSTMGQLPMVTVAPTAKVIVDLYYPLPHGLQTADEIPAFDVQWTVTTNAGPVVSTAAFDRVPLEPPPGVYAYGMGQYEWYDPAWPDHTFSDVDRIDPIYESAPLAAHAVR
jgi:hypothetical protein